MPGQNVTDLADRVAVVFGATSGLGREIAIGLAQAGANVAPTGRRAERLPAICAEIEQAGVKTLERPCDVTSREQIDRFRDQVLSAFGQVDILVNAAGVTVKEPTRTVSEETWKRIFDVNVTGTLLTCQSFYEPLRRHRRGRIINIASLAAYVSLYEVAAYNASKAGVLSLTKSLAQEWSKEGINVNAIAPGVFRTEMNKKLLDGTERGREYMIRTPLGRFGQLKEIVPAALMLASDHASFITGACLTVDGGFLASGVNS